MPTSNDKDALRRQRERERDEHLDYINKHSIYANPGHPCKKNKHEEKFENYHVPFKQTATSNNP